VISLTPHESWEPRVVLTRNAENADEKEKDALGESQNIFIYPKLNFERES